MVKRLFITLCWLIIFISIPWLTSILLFGKSDFFYDWIRGFSILGVGVFIILIIIYLILIPLTDWWDWVKRG